ncbi:MAG: hypothetical protein IPM97_13795 [Bdellovibrionaceae bacterium]|nr:hypothetical protein [Pseudobdellovibrionaceae bacterium]
MKTRAGVVSYKPHEAKGLDGFFVSKGDYQDLRLNAQNKRNIKYWEVKNKTIKVQQVFENGKVKSLRIIETKKKSIKEILFVKKGNALYLAYANQRSPQALNYSALLSKDIKCEGMNTAIDNLKKLGAEFEEEVLYNNLQNKVIDPICKKSMTENEYEKMTSALVEALSPKNKISACLRSDSTADIFARASKNTKVSLIKSELDLLALKYALESQKYYEQPESLQGNISCQSTFAEKTTARYIEGNGIQFLVPKKAGSNETTTLKEFEKKAVHEIFHSLDVLKEEVVQDLVSVCLEGTSAAKASMAAIGENEVFDIGTGVVPQAISTTQASAEAAAQNIPAAIPKTLAENEIPNAPIDKIDSPFVDSTKDVRDYVSNPEQAADAALAKSINTTAPILNFANKVTALLSTPAQASPIGSRAPASSGARSVGIVKSTMTEGYEVKEEILLGVNDSNSSKQNPDSATPRMDSNVDSSASRSLQAKRAPNEVALNSTSGVDQAAFGSNGALDTAGRTAAALKSTTRGSTNSSTAENNSAKRSPASTLKGPDREQLITFFKDYNQAKQKLTNSNFKKALILNKISVIDTAGNEVGHPRGPGVIVYLDTGTNYVRQK